MAVDPPRLFSDSESESVSRVAALRRLARLAAAGDGAATLPLALQRLGDAPGLPAKACMMR